MVDSNDRRTKHHSNDKPEITVTRDCASPRSRGVRDYRVDENGMSERSSKRNLNPSSTELSPRKPPSSPRRTIDEASLALLSINPEDQAAAIRNRTLGAPSYKRSVLVDSADRREKRTKTLGSPETGGLGSAEFLQDMRAARQSVSSKKMHKRHSAKDLLPRGDRKLVEEKSVVISQIEIQVTPVDGFVCLLHFHISFYQFLFHSFISFLYHYFVDPSCLHFRRAQGLLQKSPELRG